MSDQTERLRNDLNGLCRFCGAMPGVRAHDDDCLGVAVLAELEAAKAREEADALFRTVLGWIVEDHPFLVHGYVQGHHALDPIRDLPAFLRAFPTIDYEGWVAKHGEAMDRLAASEPPGTNTDAVLREAGYDPEEVAARSRETAMKATYGEGYGAGVMAERARIADGIRALRGASEPPGTASGEVGT